jgi:hypothetical protein
MVSEATMEIIKDGSHIPDDLLAEYALGRLPRRDVPGIFEHLLVCDDCHERYEAELTFRNDVREAAAHAAASPVPERRRNWLDLFTIPKPAWAAVAALVALVAFLPMLRQDSGPLHVVSLTAVRGGPTVAAPADSRIELRLDTTGLDASTAVSVQIVDESGSEVWAGNAAATDQRWLVQPNKRFGAGRYWVRVLDPARNNEQVREFQLDVR